MQKFYDQSLQKYFPPKINLFGTDKKISIQKKFSGIKIIFHILLFYGLMTKYMYY